MLDPLSNGGVTMRVGWASRAAFAAISVLALATLSLVLMATMPVGAIGASIGWLWGLALMCAGLLACGAVGRASLKLIWMPSLGALVRYKRLRLASVLVVCAAATVNWLDPRPILPPTRDPTNYAPPCYLIPAATQGIKNVTKALLLGLMGHGRRPANQASVCFERQIISPRHGLPWMLAAVLLVGLWSRHWSLEEEERRAAQSERIASLKQSGADPTGAVLHPATAADTERSSLQSLAAKSVPSPQPAQRPARKKETLGSALDSLVEHARALFDRAPLIATAALVYLGGGALTVLGLE